VLALSVAEYGTAQCRTKSRSSCANLHAVGIWARAFGIAGWLGDEEGRPQRAGEGLGQRDPRGGLRTVEPCKLMTKSGHEIAKRLECRLCRIARGPHTPKAPCVLDSPLGRGICRSRCLLACVHTALLLRCFELEPACRSLGHSCSPDALAVWTGIYMRGLIHGSMVMYTLGYP